MNTLYEIKSALQTILPPTFWDIIDIAVLSFVIYKLILFLRNTRADGLAKGLLIFAAAYAAAFVFNLKAMSFILEKAFNVGILAVVILFQPELRRTLEKVGHSFSIPLLNQRNSATPEEINKRWKTAVDAVCTACNQLSRTKTGALIVIEGKDKLGEYIETGTLLDAEPTKEMFLNIFNKNAPLHDGAIIMRDGMIHAAACMLPNTAKNEYVNNSLGTRHRAAIGMSENSDALVIVVSEETGKISAAIDGEFTKGTLKTNLLKFLKNREKPLPMSDKKNITKG